MALHLDAAPQRMSIPTFPVNPSSLAGRRETTALTIVAVAAEHEVRPTEILGRRRFPRLAAARQEVCRRLVALGWSYAEVGRQLGLDHTTVIHAVRKGDGIHTLQQKEA